MPYKLKLTEPPFEVVDGPCAGRKYSRKGIYAEIPPQCVERFEDTEVQGKRGKDKGLNLEPLTSDLAPSDKGGSHE